MHIKWQGYHEIVLTLKPYHMLKNLFKLIALTGDMDGKTLDVGSHTHEPPGETFTALYLIRLILEIQHV